MAPVGPVAGVSTGASNDPTSSALAAIVDETAITTASAPARLIRLGLSWYPMIRPGLTTESDKYPCGPVRSTRILSAPSARHGRSRRISGRKGQDGRDCPRFFRTGPLGGPS